MNFPLLPDPEPRRRDYVLISADDHLIEPKDLFDGRLPLHMMDAAPKVVDTEAGHQVWLYEGATYPMIGMDVAAGRAKEHRSMEPVRFEQMRPGCYDIEARIEDMDRAGVWASLCFPTTLAGYAGTVFSRTRDRELGLAVLRAWNDWHVEVWAGTYPERMIALQLPWLGDPVIAAAEIRNNAERGFKAVSFPDFPSRLRLPSIHTSHWDPFFAACEETSTVVCLHTGSASWAPVPSPDTPFEAITTLLPTTALFACVDWLWSGIPLRFPNLKILIVEGGIGWVPMLAERADRVLDHPVISGDEPAVWTGDLKPSEVLRRNFFFSSLDDQSAYALRGAIGVENILLECGYPHADSTWPDIQRVVNRDLGRLPGGEVGRISYGNAARLFGHPLPSRAWLRGESLDEAVNGRTTSVWLGRAPDVRDRL
ncbi:amidohydrolase family protein [Rhizohabitans arisaemae]|uniref:amidohydrolase family protein n=1 Tax=Rhizohabitans arisaemae TaxID=2720610 RepID=UPI0024B2150A|nr:amidohydrolase family protein [Rhizohabitans arisaemae]